MRKQLAITYETIISVENLLEAWKEFSHGKRSKLDVQMFQLHLMDNILALHGELAMFRYRHSPYHAFKINDPKPRDIHKANVRDRLVHHALHRKLFPDHRVLRTVTKRRMLRRMGALRGRSSPPTEDRPLPSQPTEDSPLIASYLGTLSHGNSWKLQGLVHVCS